MSRRGPSANSSVNHHCCAKGAWAPPGRPWKYVTQLKERKASSRYDSSPVLAKYSASTAASLAVWLSQH